MTTTPGVIIPSSYSSRAALLKDLNRRSEAAGYTPFDDVLLGLEHSNVVDEFLEHFGNIPVRTVNEFKFE